VVVVIGVFKLVKAALLSALGVGAFLGLPQAIVPPALRALRWIGAFSGHHAVRAAFVKLSTIDDHEMREVAAASLGYAAVFMVEGIGLLRKKRWAEWLTVIVTASFIPFEIYELVRHPGAGKIVALAVNGAVVIYLVWRRLEERGRSRVSRFRTA